MKKLLICVLILAVLGIVGGFAYLELNVPEIEFVSDTAEENGENAYVLHRLYSSNVDFEGLTKSLNESLVSVEFTEDDILKAALESGTPEFFPAFYVKSEKSSENENEFFLTGSVVQELADGQTDTRFRLQNLRVEMITTGITIEEAKNLVDDKNIAYKAAVISDTKNQMTLECASIGKYEARLNGTSGQVILQYTFDVYSATLLNRECLTRHLIQIYADVTTDENEKLAVAYTHTDYYTIDGLAEALAEGGEETSPAV